MASCARGIRIGVTLIGGNITQTTGPLMLDVTAIGTCTGERC